MANISINTVTNANITKTTSFINTIANVALSDKFQTFNIAGVLQKGLLSTVDSASVEKYSLINNPSTYNLSNLKINSNKIYYKNANNIFKFQQNRFLSKIDYTKYKSIRFVFNNLDESLDKFTVIKPIWEHGTDKMNLYSCNGGVMYSKISQQADQISMNVYDTIGNNTGINVSTGEINLNAANFKVTYNDTTNLQLNAAGKLEVNDAVIKGDVEASSFIAGDLTTGMQTKINEDKFEFWNASFSIASPAAYFFIEIDPTTKLPRVNLSLGSLGSTDNGKTTYVNYTTLDFSKISSSNAGSKIKSSATSDYITYFNSINYKSSNYFKDILNSETIDIAYVADCAHDVYEDNTILYKNVSDISTAPANYNKYIMFNSNYSDAKKDTDTNLVLPSGKQYLITDLTNETVKKNSEITTFSCKNDSSLTGGIYRLTTLNITSSNKYYYNYSYCKIIDKNDYTDEPLYSIYIEDDGKFLSNSEMPSENYSSISETTIVSNYNNTNYSFTNNEIYGIDNTFEFDPEGTYCYISPGLKTNLNNSLIDYEYDTINSSKNEIIFNITSSDLLDSKLVKTANISIDLSYLSSNIDSLPTKDNWDGTKLKIDLIGADEKFNLNITSKYKITNIDEDDETLISKSITTTCPSITDFRENIDIYLVTKARITNSKKYSVYPHWEQNWQNYAKGYGYDRNFQFIYESICYNKIGYNPHSFIEKKSILTSSEMFGNISKYFYNNTDEQLTKIIPIIVFPSKEVYDAYDKDIIINVFNTKKQARIDQFAINSINNCENGDLKSCGFHNYNCLYMDKTKNGNIDNDKQCDCTITIPNELLKIYGNEYPGVLILYKDGNYYKSVFNYTGLTNNTTYNINNGDKQTIYYKNDLSNSIHKDDLTTTIESYLEKYYNIWTLAENLPENNGIYAKIKVISNTDYLFGDYYGLCDFYSRKYINNSGDQWKLRSYYYEMITLESATVKADESCSTSEELSTKDNKGYKVNIKLWSPSE